MHKVKALLIVAVLMLSGRVCIAADKVEVPVKKLPSNNWCDTGKMNPIDVRMWKIRSDTTSGTADVTRAQNEAIAAWYAEMERLEKALHVGVSKETRELLINNQRAWEQWQRTEKQLVTSPQMVWNSYGGTLGMVNLLDRYLASVRARTCDLYTWLHDLRQIIKEEDGGDDSQYWPVRN
ncbi:MAG: DUF1311 domain-containing protein [Oxalobacter sp.]|nr:MAG: DUF1311 domain-containing protein [Oxalobacter sp.]